MARPAQTGRQRWVTHRVDRTSGTDAQRANVAAGRAVASAVRTTLGPNGMDKMLVGSDGTVVVTNDGASVLERMEVADPTARMLVDVAATQSETVGDGTTTAVLLTGELLAEAESLLADGLHPTTVVEGYRQAAVRVRERLPEYGVSVDADDDEQLRDVARTAVTGKWDDAAADLFASLAVESVRSVATADGVDLRNVVARAYPGGELRESECVDGLLVDMNTSSTTIEAFDVGLPRRFADARVALVDREITIDTADAVSNATVSDVDQLERLRQYESDVRSTAVRTAVDLGVDVLFCQKSIDDDIRAALARNGILAVERTRQDELDALARATGGTAVLSVSDLDESAVGHAGSVERHEVGTTQVLTVADCPGQRQVSLLLRGGTEHVADETKRIVEDCLRVVQIALREAVVLPGGGAIEAALARDLSAHADSVGGREQLAVRAFGDALEAVPETLASNAGRSPVDVLVALRDRHHAGDHAVGVDRCGAVVDVVDDGVFEPHAVVSRCVTNAFEAATMVLRVDDVVAAEDRGDGNGHDDHDHDHGGVVHDTNGYPWAVGH